ncbi:MAG: hypothetical protein IPF58_02660 [Saprospirales bacterium]|nr:hypothetical protein [Saprospirales bacterium]
MKKLMILAVVASLAFGASCKKNKDNCDCSTITDLTKGSLTDDQFKQACDAASAADKLSGGTGCSLK